MVSANVDLRNIRNIRNKSEMSFQLARLAGGGRAGSPIGVT